MKLRDLFRRKTTEPPYRWHVEAKLEQQVWQAIQVERAGGLARYFEAMCANQNAAMAAMRVINPPVVLTPRMSEQLQAQLDAGLGVAATSWGKVL